MAAAPGDRRRFAELAQDFLARIADSDLSAQNERREEREAEDENGAKAHEPAHADHAIRAPQARPSIQPVRGETSRSPNSAVPTRTSVLPAITAISRSPVIPIESSRRGVLNRPASSS